VDDLPHPRSSPSAPLAYFGFHRAPAASSSVANVVPVVCRCRRFDLARIRSPPSDYVEEHRRREGVPTSGDGCVSDWPGTYGSVGPSTRGTPGSGSPGVAVEPILRRGEPDVDEGPDRVGGAVDPAGDLGLVALPDRLEDEIGRILASRRATDPDPDPVVVRRPERLRERSQPVVA